MRKHLAEQFELRFELPPVSLLDTKCPECGVETGGGRCSYHQDIRDDGYEAVREMEMERESESQW